MRHPSRFAWLLSAGLLMLCAVAAAKPYRGAEYRTIASYTYGRFEVRMKSAPVSGMLSSFFTFHEIATLADWNELDIEIMGRYTNEVQFNTITAWTTNHVQRQVVRFNPHAAFHIYAMEWTPDYVAWQVDGIEVYRQTADHIRTLNRSQKLMMNIWPPSDAGWAGTLNPQQLPAYAYYDWVRYYSYTPGISDNFSLQWVDNMDGFDATRWQKASHTWDQNLADLIPQNVAFRDGYMILCLTDQYQSGYSGGPVVDTDVDAPYAMDARGLGNTIVVRFSEPVEQASAEIASNYLAAGVTIPSARLEPDGRTVTLSTTGLDPAAGPALIVRNIDDKSSPPHRLSLQSVRVAPPLPFPVAINIGGEASGAFRADSVWSDAKQYGYVGGAVTRTSPSYIPAGTDEPEIFRTAVEGLSFYHLRVPNGLYTITLMMVETKYSAAGKRVFSVAANGRSAIQDLDIVQRAGMNTVFTQAISDVAVNNGLLSLHFTASADKPVLSAVRVERVATGVTDRADVPRTIRLDIYPNPFNPTVNLAFTLTERSEVHLRVCNVLGEVIGSSSLGWFEAGAHRTTWDGGGYPSGAYFFSMTAKNQEAIQRGVLMR